MGGPGSLRASHMDGIAAAALGLARARKVDDHGAHHARGVVEEVVLVHDRQGLRTDQAQVGLVHQRGGIKEGHGLVPAQLGARQAAQLDVEQAEGLAGGLAITLAGGAKEFGDRWHGGRPLRLPDGSACLEAS